MLGIWEGVETALTLCAAYDDLNSRLGPCVIIQRMAGKGVELAMDCVRDPDFGPLVMVSARGTLIELLADRQFVLAPFDEEKAMAMIESLSVVKIPNGIRGAPQQRASSPSSRNCARWSETGPANWTSIRSSCRSVASSRLTRCLFPQESIGMHAMADIELRAL